MEKRSITSSPTLGDLNDLRPYQSEGVQFLTTNHSAFLADEMGLGKTVQSAVALSFLLSHFPGRALVVAPASVTLTWLTELRKWAPILSVRFVRGSAADRRVLYSLPVKVLITTYELMRLDAKSISGEEFSVVILDEAQRIKNMDSETALACCTIRRDRAWALTGTPLENRLDDLVSIFRFVKPGLLSIGMAATTIKKMTKPLMLRRTAAEVFDELPPINTQVIELDLMGTQLSVYREAWNSRHDLEGQDGPTLVANMLALITRLKIICNQECASGESVKHEALLDLLEGLSGSNSKILVFSQYVSSIEWLSSRLPGSFQIEQFHGSLTREKRQSLVRWFEDGQGDQILLISLQAGGVGLNLGSATHVVLFDRWWNPAVEEQAIRRAYRFGRDRPLFVYKFLVADTIEERIQAILDGKLELFNQIIGPLSIEETSGSTLERILDITPTK